MFLFGGAFQPQQRIGEAFLHSAAEQDAREPAHTKSIREWVLNCQPHDIPALITSRLLKPLGNPAQNGGKFFCTADVLELLKDRFWLVKVTNTINQHWQRQNSRKKCPSLNGGQNGLGLKFKGSHV